jgi:carboxyl-terminal processing protease
MPTRRPSPVAISLHASLAALGGGALVWGPLGGGWAAALLAGAVLGLLGWALSRRRSLARFGLHGAIALGFVAAVLIPLYRLNILLPETSDRQANFERLWRAMDAYYPYFALKSVDWDATYRRYQPLVPQRATNLRTGG